MGADWHRKCDDYRIDILSQFRLILQLRRNRLKELEYFRASDHEGVDKPTRTAQAQSAHQGLLRCGAFALPGEPNGAHRQRA